MKFRRTPEEQLARKIRRVEDRLADTQDDLHKWGWSYAPSRNRRIKETIAELEAELAELEAQT